MVVAESRVSTSLGMWCAWQLREQPKFTYVTEAAHDTGMRAFRPAMDLIPRRRNSCAVRTGHR